MIQPRTALAAGAAALILAACGATDSVESPGSLAGGGQSASGPTIQLNGTVFSAPAVAQVTVTYPNGGLGLALPQPLTVTVSSSTSRHGEELTLSEGVPGEYSALFVILTGEEVPGNGELEVQPGDRIVATFHDPVDRQRLRATAVADAAPDLVAESVSGDVSTTPYLTVSALVHNAGKGLMPGAYSRLYLSADQTLDAGDLVLQDVYLGDVVAGADYAWQYRAPLATLPPGTWYVLLVADADDKVFESSETNNVVASAQPVVIPTDAPPSPPDLVADFVTIVTTGSVTLITDTVRAAAGTEAPGDFLVRIYLSPDGGPFGAILVAERVVSGLAPGEARTTTTTVPAGLAKGLYPYHAYLAVDPTNVVAETNENNNTRTSSTQAVVR